MGTACSRQLSRAVLVRLGGDDESASFAQEAREDAPVGRGVLGDHLSATLLPWHGLCLVGHCVEKQGALEPPRRP